MTTHLYMGMGPPYFVAFVIAAGPDFDPVAAAAATTTTLMVTKPSGVEVEWSAEIISSNAEQITLKHRFDVGDLDERGVWSVWARFMLADGGELRTEVGKTPTILAKNQTTP